MNVLSTRLHAKTDYITGILFFASPWIFGFTEIVPATWTVIAVAVTALTMSLFTDYEGGIVRSLPMRIHLIIDFASGGLVAVSPWLFGFADEVYVPHLVIGLFEVFASLLTTRRAPDQNTRPVVDPDADGVNGSTY